MALSAGRLEYSYGQSLQVMNVGHLVALRQFLRRDDYGAAELTSLFNISRHVVNRDVEHNYRVAFGRARPDAAFNAVFRLRVNRAIAERVVGVDRPPEELAIKLRRLVGILRDDLPSRYWLSHGHCSFEIST